MVLNQLQLSDVAYRCLGSSPQTVAKFVNKYAGRLDDDKAMVLKGEEVAALQRVLGQFPDVDGLITEVEKRGRVAFNGKTFNLDSDRLRRIRDLAIRQMGRPGHTEEPESVLIDRWLDRFFETQLSLALGEL